MYSNLSKKRNGVSHKAKPSRAPLCEGSGRQPTALMHKARGAWKYVICILGALMLAVLLLGVLVSRDESNSIGTEGLIKRAQDSGASVKQQVSRRAVEVDSGEYGPKIKGLRLGMKYDDVNAVVRRLCDQHNSAGPKYPVCVSYENGDLIVLHSVAKDTGNYCQFQFNDGRLVWFGLEGEILQLAFGVSPDNISDKQLLQMFLDNYGIPSVKTQTFTFSRPTRVGDAGGVETLSSYDGSANGGFAFKFRGYRSRSFGLQKWSFAVHRFSGWEFGLPAQITMSEVNNYQQGFGPVIKGFQLGMSRAEVVKLVDKIWNTAKPTEEGDRIYFQANGDFPDLDFSFRNGKLCKLNISGELFAWLYHADPQYEFIKDFAQRAINYYHIPSVEGKSKSTSSQMATCYDCTMENGIEFWVEENRRPNSATWSIGCRYIDMSKFD